MKVIEIVTGAKFYAPSCQWFFSNPVLMTITREYSALKYTRKYERYGTEIFNTCVQLKV